MNERVFWGKISETSSFDTNGSVRVVHLQASCHNFISYHHRITDCHSLTFAIVPQGKTFLRNISAANISAATANKRSDAFGAETSKTPVMTSLKLALGNNQCCESEPACTFSAKCFFCYWAAA